MYKTTFEFECYNSELTCVYVSQLTKKNPEIYVSMIGENISSLDSMLIKTDKFVTAEEELLNTNDEIKKQMIDLLKNKYIEMNLVQESNIEFWNVDHINYITTEEGNEYYQFVGTYKCKDGEISCVYVEQISDVPTSGIIEYKVFVEIKDNNIVQIFGALPEIRKVPSELALKESVKRIAEKTNTYNSSKTEYWNINSVEYVGYISNPEVKYYLVRSEYKCKDNGNDCVYQSQISEEATEDNKYTYNFYISITNNDIESLKNIGSILI